jgi:hypothetical protein
MAVLLKSGRIVLIEMYLPERFEPVNKDVLQRKRREHENFPNFYFAGHIVMLSAVSSAFYAAKSFSSAEAPLFQPALYLYQ